DDRSPAGRGNVQKGSASASTAALGKLLPTERKDARHERGGMAGSGASRCYVWPAAVEIKSRIHGRSGSFACLGNRREYRDFSIAGCHPAARITCEGRIGTGNHYPGKRQGFLHCRLVHIKRRSLHVRADGGGAAA